MTWCDHYDAGRCRSCAWLPDPYADQLARKTERARSLLPAMEWLAPVASPERGFRNKAKMVVAGSVDSPTVGILDSDGLGVDLRDCGLHEPAIMAALPVLADFVQRARLAPYSVPERRGELKHLLVTASPTGELMVRFVMRSTEALARLRKHLPWLQETLPGLRVVSLNVQPAHAAVLEGPVEHLLTELSDDAVVPAAGPITQLHGAALPMRVNDVTLHLRPQSFFQTNTSVAARLYALARTWTDDIDPRSVLDLYCGVGGFAFHLAVSGRTVTGVEVSEEAVNSARSAADAAGLALSFVAGDAASYAESLEAPPDLVVVNPPRRGIGVDLAGWLDRSGVPHVLYSSCHVESLARDLATMPSLRPVRGVVLDMFPHTPHHEVLVQLTRS